MNTSVDIGAAFELKLGNLHDDVKSILHREPPKPRYFPVSGSIQGNGVIDLNRPNIGYMWNILSVMLVGSDDHTAVTGTAALYVDTDSTGLGLVQCRIPNMVIPTSQFISKGTLWAHSDGNVCVNVAGTSGSPTVTATITVAEWRVKDISASRT